MQPVSPSSVKKKAKTALRKHGKVNIFERPATEHLDRMVGESDRGAIVLMGSMLEDALEYRLREKFVGALGNDADHLFAFGGPVGTFSAKISMAHALGLISGPLREILEVMRHLRNAAAHIQGDITFETESIEEAVRSILDGETIDIIDKDGDKNKILRDSFVLAGIAMRIVIGYVEQNSDDPVQSAAIRVRDHIASHETVPVLAFARKSQEL